MAQDIDGLPYWEVSFDEDGKVLHDDDLRAEIEANGVEELFVMAHGWNNSVASARDLFNDVFTRLSRLLQQYRPDRHGRVGVVGVLWPSLVLPDDDPTRPVEAAAGAGQAAALAPAFPQQVEALKQIDGLISAKLSDPDRLEEAHRLIAGLVTTAGDAPEDTGMNAVVTASTSVVFGHLASLWAPNNGDAQGIGNVFTGLWQGAKEALRVASYFEMKNRAGVVGQRGLGPLLGELQAKRNGLRVHLLGHSFGGRLVSFALDGLPDNAVNEASPVKSLLLIQAAFSHFTFADPIPVASASPRGRLAGCRNRVDGPLVATFSAADLAVGRWYPSASMINGQDSESLTDLTYRWGAMGHDGYQQDDSVQLELLPTGQPYVFPVGKLCRLKSDAVIAAMEGRFGAHCDIRHDEVVWAAVSAASAAQ